MAFDRLIENIVKTQNPSVVGLDPKLDYVPEYIKEKKFKKYVINYALLILKLKILVKNME